tara:strand:- start:1545 stop:2450 length:906 start_codon:yes stop_codon:yes gene_type:complete
MSRTITKKRGLVLTPHSVDDTGLVTFTDGTLTDLPADQITCEAYGYRYNVATGTCSAFVPKPDMMKALRGRDKKVLGVKNDIEAFSQNNLIVGTNNTNKSYNCNTMLLGSDHETVTGIKNSAIIGGSNGKLQRQGEILIAGGQTQVTNLGDGGDIPDISFNSRRQTSTLELSCVTRDNTATNMTIQGDGSSFINVQNNSIIGYDIYITRLELGGTSGVNGNYSYRNIRGAVKIDRAGNMSFVVGFSRNIAKIGQNGTCVMADSTTGGVPSISVNVQDRNNVQNLWSASVTLHEVISETLIS